MNLLIRILAISALSILFYSCSGCVKNTSKKVTELVGNAVDGVNEAVKEDEGKRAEETADATGTVVEGVGRSVDRQLDENSEKVGSTVGRTLAQSISGTIDGLTEEMGKIDVKDYDTLKYVTKFPDELSLHLVGKKKYSSKVDVFFKMPAGNAYKVSLDFYDKEGNIIIYKDLNVRKKADDRRTLTNWAFTLSPTDQDFYKKTERVEIKAERLIEDN